MIYRHVFIARSVLATFRREVQRVLYYKETGGPLVGYISADGALVVTHAGGPGPRAEHRQRSVLIDGAYAQKFCDKIHRESDGRLDYVGDWHNHPGLSLSPSSHDVEAMKTMADFDYCPVEHPISIIYRRIPEKFSVYILTKEGNLSAVQASIIETVPTS